MSNNTCTKHIVDFAMKATLKDVRLPKCVRDGIVEPIADDKSFFSFDADKWEKAKQNELERFRREHRAGQSKPHTFSVMFDPS